VCHFETALYRHWNERTGQSIRLAILEELQDASDIVLVDLGKLGDILVGEEFLQVCGLGRVAPQDVKDRACLEDAGDLVAGEEHRDLSLGRLNPLRQFALGVGIGSIHFIQDQTQRLGIVAQERRDASRVLTGLHKGLHIRKTADGLTCVEFQDFELTGSRGSQSQRGFADARRSVQKHDLGIRRRLKVRSQAILHLRVSDDLLQHFGASGFAPHGLSS